MIDELGKPHVILRGRVKEVCDHQQIIQGCISLSHTKQVAVAFVVFEQ
jgi:phosphopantetheinyl transferase (holo-ACP synthase)